MGGGSERGSYKRLSTLCSRYLCGQSHAKIVRTLHSNYDIEPKL